MGALIAIFNHTNTLLYRRLYDVVIDEIPELNSEFLHEAKHSNYINRRGFCVFSQLFAKSLFLFVLKDVNELIGANTMPILTQAFDNLCGSDFSEKSIINASFDLTIAFDEIINCGLPISLPIGKLEEILEMYSIEEKTHEIISQVSSQYF